MLSRDESISNFQDPQVNLYVRDPEMSAAFYRNLFGFTETFRTPKEGRADHIELRLESSGGFILGLASIEAARDVHGLDPGNGKPKGEIVFWTDDVDSAFSELIAKGAKPVRPPHNFIETLRAAWIADPDGNYLQIVMRFPKN